MRYTFSQLLDPAGREVWAGPHADRLGAVRAASGPAGDAAAALWALAGDRAFPDGRARPRDLDVAGASERLGLTSRRGMPRGFFVLPPPGAFLERCVEAFNARQFDRLGAVELRLPAVYSAAGRELAELTAGYEADGRTFPVGDGSERLRLSYAADPALFAWLAGRRLKASALPYAVVSPMEIFRRHRSGELGPLNRTSQYALPDLHLFATPEGAEAACLEMVGANAEGVRFWSGDGHAQFIDLTDDFAAEHPDLAARMARAAGCHTLVNRFAAQPRYYRMRSGLSADVGTDALMLYNIQWDEENAPRFAVSLDRGGAPVILHGNGLAGSGVLCATVGRALAGLAPRRRAPELAPICVHVQPARTADDAFAAEYAAKLSRAGLRAWAEPPPSGGLGGALRRLRADWAAAIVVVGDRERAGAAPRFEVDDGLALDEAEFLARTVPRVLRCAPLRAGAPAPLPLA